MMSALPELLLLRHGQTEWNREGRFQGARDSRLTDLGRAQAMAMGSVLRDLGVGPGSHRALTSPQGRARATASLALQALNLEARDDPRLVEIGMGDWTGLTREEIDRRWPGPPGEPLLDFYARCPAGESLGELARRAEGVLATLERPTIIVTHGITLRVLCALALAPLADISSFMDMHPCSPMRATLANRPVPKSFIRIFASFFHTHPSELRTPRASVCT